MQKVELTREELEMIGQHRYREMHGRHMTKITLLCYVAAAVLAVSMLKFFSGTSLYIFALAPAVLPMYLYLRLSNQATKAGAVFADGLSNQKDS